MATFIFDGTTNVTAAKTDTVVISANPALFTGVSDVGGNSSVFNFGGKTLTITGTTFGPNADSFPNVSIANGTFSTSFNGAGTLAPVTANDLIIAPSNTAGQSIDVSGGGTAASIKAVYGGVGVSDPSDGADSIVIGGKGSFLVYGNAGADTITQNGAFDSQSFVTVFGGKNTGANDTITLNTANNTDAKMAIYGGEGSDTITVVNTGTNANTTIFGGQGAADSTDSADVITFNGGGVVNIFGNAGNDTINLGNNATGLDSTANVTIHGGIGADNTTVAVNGSKATIVVYGDENVGSNAADRDVITVSGNAGTTVIYGGTAAADASDGNDTITYSGQGTATIYAAGGNDIVNLNGAGLTPAGAAVASDSTSTVTVFGGAGNDSINITNVNSVTQGTQTITLGAGADVVTAGSSDTPGVTESSAINFVNLAATETVTVGGLTFTAGNTGATAAQVATSFANEVGGAGQGAVGGTFSNALTGFTSGAANGTSVTFTSSTANTNVGDIGVSTSSVNSPAVTTTQGAAAIVGGTAGVGTGITVTDFSTAAGADRLVVSNGIAGGGTFNIVDGSTAATQQAALDLAVKAASNAAGTVSGVVFQGSAYVVVNNDGNNVFNASADLAIKLTGVTDLAALSSATTII